MLNIVFKILLNYRKQVLLALALLALGGYFAYTLFGPKTTTSPENQVVDPKRSYHSLIPNQTTHKEIISQLGQPQGAFEQDDLTVYMYPSSTSYYAPDQLYVKNDILQLKELYYTPEQFSYSVNRLTSIYGKPDKVLYQPYNPYTENYVYVYPDQGVAAYITKEHKVFKLQIFSPTDLQTYRQTWAKELTDTKPTKPKTFDPHIH